MDALSQTPLTMATTKAGLTAGTTTTITTANTTQYCIKGLAYSKAGATNAATPTTDATTGAAFVAVPASNGCAFVVGLDSSGAFKVSQGPLYTLSGEASGANTTTLLGAMQLPIVPDTVCPIGYIVVEVGASGSSWTFGSSNLAGPPSNVNIAFTDVMTLPDRPIAA